MHRAAAALHVPAQAAISPLCAHTKRLPPPQNVRVGRMPAFRKNRSSANRRDARHFALGVVREAMDRGHVMFVDGSTLGGRNSGPTGAGVHIQRHRGAQTTRAIGVAKEANSFIGESVGLLEAASHAALDPDLRDHPVTTVCDCQPALKAAVRGTGLGRLTHALLRGAGRIIHVVWIPSHVGVLGNRRADEAAARAAEGMRTAEAETDLDLASWSHLKERVAAGVERLRMQEWQAALRAHARAAESRRAARSRREDREVQGRAGPQQGSEERGQVEGHWLQQVNPEGVPWTSQEWHAALRDHARAAEPGRAGGSSRAEGEAQGRAGPQQVSEEPGRAEGHISQQTNPEGLPWRSRHRGPVAQETQMARLRHGGARTRANKAWTFADAGRKRVGTLCACGEAEESIPHILLHCVRSLARRRRRDLRTHALFLADKRVQSLLHPDIPPPEPPDMTLATLLNCQASTRTSIAVEAEACACIRDTQGDVTQACTRVIYEVRGGARGRGRLGEGAGGACSAKGSGSRPLARG